LPATVLEGLSETSDISAFELLETHKWLSEGERRLTEDFSAQQLCTHIAERRVTALEVCRAFCHRAAVAQQLVSTVLFRVSIV
jgi:amidase